MIELQQTILQLSIADRLRLISFIAASISQQEIQLETPQEWIDEARSRIERASNGESPLYSWDEVKARVYGKGDL